VRGKELGRSPASSGRERRARGPAWKGRKWAGAKKNNNLFYLIDLIKRSSSHSQKKSKKYIIEGLEIRNNLSYWSFSKFRMKFELKIQGSYRV
jgi:hypothetical protein